MKNIVIIGAGFAGIYAAKHLSSKLKGHKDYQIVLVDRHYFMTYQTELHEVATERVNPEHVQEDLEMLFHKSGNIKILTADVTAIDAKNKTITASNAQISYEKLIIATGGESNDFGTPGVKEFGFELWSFEEAMKIRQHIRATITRGASQLNIDNRNADLTVAIVGSGFTGTEVAGEMIQLRKVLAKENNLNPNDIKIVMLEAAPSILNMFEKRELADKAEDYMTGNGIQIIKNAMVTQVTADGVVFKDGSKLPTHSLIWTAGVRAKSAIQSWGLKFEAGRGGRIIVDSNMKIKGYEDIYAVGDTVEWVDPKWGPTPQTVEGAESMASTAVKNITAEVHGNKSDINFKRIFNGYAVSVGSHYSVATKIFNSPLSFTGFIANIIKHGINLYYFLQIKSLGSIWKYLTNEFFRMQNNREPLAGILSRQGNTLWSLPLRIFMGVFWIMIGAGVANRTGMNVATLQIPALMLGASLVLGAFTTFGAMTSILMAIISMIFGHSVTPLLPIMVIFASFDLLNGAGRNLGVDHWLQPALQKVLGNLWYGKRLPIYHEVETKTLTQQTTKKKATKK